MIASVSDRESMDKFEDSIRASTRQYLNLNLNTKQAAQLMYLRA